MVQSDAAKQSLSRQVLSAEQALVCALRWREDCTRYAVEQAGAWMRPPSQPCTPAACDADAQQPATADGAMLPRPMEGSTSAGEGGTDEMLAVASGHVEICGVTLPKRADGGSSGMVVPGRRGLVRTPAVEAALEAAAMVLAQERPLLLEGPPGLHRYSSCNVQLCLLCVSAERCGTPNSMC